MKEGGEVERRTQDEIAALNLCFVILFSLLFTLCGLL